MRRQPNKTRLYNPSRCWSCRGLEHGRRRCPFGYHQYLRNRTAKWVKNTSRGSRPFCAGSERGYERTEEQCNLLQWLRYRLLAESSIAAVKKFRCSVATPRRLTPEISPVVKELRPLSFHQHGHCQIEATERKVTKLTLEKAASIDLIAARNAASDKNLILPALLSQQKNVASTTKRRCVAAGKGEFSLTIAPVLLMLCTIVFIHSAHVAGAFAKMCILSRMVMDTCSPKRTDLTKSIVSLARNVNDHSTLPSRRGEELGRRDPEIVSLPLQYCASEASSSQEKLGKSKKLCIPLRSAICISAAERSQQTNERAVIVLGNPEEAERMQDFFAEFQESYPVLYMENEDIEPIILR